jgi:hypothetical protein
MPNLNKLSQMVYRINGKAHTLTFTNLALKSVKVPENKLSRLTLHKDYLAQTPSII